MSTTWLRAALGAALLGFLHLTSAVVTPAAAQQGPPDFSQGPPPGRGPEQRLEELTKTLNLSPEQQQQVAAIFSSQHQQMQALFAGAQGDRDAALQGMRQLDSDTDAKLKAVLTPEQYDKYQVEKPQRGPGGKPGKARKPGKAPKTGAATGS